MGQVLLCKKHPKTDERWRQRQTRSPAVAKVGPTIW